MRIDTEEEIFERKVIGDWCFHSDNKYILIGYPKKSGYLGEPDLWDVTNLPIKKAGELDDRPLTWTWDGNLEAPTITPSINVIGIWHGFLTAGKIITV